MAMQGNIWLCRAMKAMYDYVRLCRVMYGYVGLSRAIYRYLRLCRTMYLYAGLYIYTLVLGNNVKPLYDAYTTYLPIILTQPKRYSSRISS